MKKIKLIVGADFVCKMYSNNVEGKIQKEGRSWFLCQNSYPGYECSDRLGYKYSYKLPEEIESVYIKEFKQTTIRQGTNIYFIGEYYSSNILKEGKIIPTKYIKNEDFSHGKLSVPYVYIVIAKDKSHTRDISRLINKTKSPKMGEVKPGMRVLSKNGGNIFRVCSTSSGGIVTTHGHSLSYDSFVIYDDDVNYRPKPKLIKADNNLIRIEMDRIISMSIYLSNSFANCQLDTLGQMNSLITSREPLETKQEILKLLFGVSRKKQILIDINQVLIPKLKILLPERIKIKSTTNYTSTNRSRMAIIMLLKS